MFASHRICCSPLHRDFQIVASQVRHWIVVLLLFVTSISAAKAGDILRYMPEDALGFVLIRNLDGVNAKLERLLRRFEMPLPSPLTFAKITTGLEEGLDSQGDLLVALLPGPRELPAAQPMVLLPVADYPKFANSIHGDATGEICRVTIADEEVLAAKVGPHALLMNVEHRETLELMMGLDPAPVASLQPLQPWIAENDLVVALMPEGVDTLLKLGRQGITQQRERLANEFDDPEFAKMLSQMRESLEFYQWILDQVGTEIGMIAVGASSDERNNLRLSQRLLLESGVEVSSAEGLSGPGDSMLAGLPSHPFVIAGGGSLSESWSTTIAKFSRHIMEDMPNVYGLDDLEAAQWDKLEESYNSLAKGVQSFSMIMFPGEKEQPFFSNVFGTMRVEDADTYLESYQETAKIWNEIMAASTSDIKYEYEVNPITVAGMQGREIIADVAAAARDERNEGFDWLLESMFGKDGKLRTLLIAADKHTIVSGLADEQQMTTYIENSQVAAEELRDTEDVGTTLKLLDAAAPWKMLVSPQGCVQWATRFMNEFLVPLQGQTIDIPAFDACPPLGVSLNMVDAQVEMDMVWPAETLNALASYIKKCQRL